MSGLDVLKQLRQKSAVPVLMLTARGSELDRILGLELGADDYLPKPFNPRELVARLRAILRTSPKRYRRGRASRAIYGTLREPCATCTSRRRMRLKPRSTGARRRSRGTPPPR